MLSGIFLEELQTAFAKEWENITTASLTAIHCFIPLGIPNSLFHSLVIPYYLVIPYLLTTSLKMLSGIFLEELQTAFAEEWENITGAALTAIPCFTPWSFFITLSFPVYLQLALRCYQVYFWRNCRRLLPKSGKISQQHH